MGSVEFELLLLDSIWRVVGVHSHHRQQCKKYVQMAALIFENIEHGGQLQFQESSDVVINNQWRKGERWKGIKRRRRRSSVLSAIVDQFPLWFYRNILEDGRYFQESNQY